MAFTMHSHSGQFCPGHAVNTLESILVHAISIGYKTIGLTEHMPRTSLSDLYPEELVPSPEDSLAALAPRHEAFLTEAKRLQDKYKDQIHILVGFEGEWIRPEYETLVKELADDKRVDYYIGSLHHVSGVPIDFDKAMYASAKGKVGGGETEMWERYYDEQYEMLKALQPRVVGHFDLIRLMSEEPNRDPREWRGVWERVERNLEFVKGYGGWLECNTSGLRKGLKEPYPGRAVAERWVEIGGQWTFSDDSHGIRQVATCYEGGLGYLEGLGVTEVWTLERTEAGLREKRVGLDEFRGSLRSGE
ncbi:hypothetical protein OQA88_13095 [Cercophora sp. LCS_1]